MTKLYMKLFITISMVFIFTGCAVVQSEISVFHNLPKVDKSTTIKYSFQKLTWQENNLEFDTYKDKVKVYLTKYNYIEDKNAKLLLQINYGINNGMDKTTTVPIYGRIGTGMNGVPINGQIGTSNSINTEYKRFFNLSIFEKNDNKLVYDGRVLSSGFNSQILSVIDEMIEAFFQEFPGTSGKSRFVEILSKE